MAKSVLDGKIGLVLNLESDGADTRSANVFQVSIMMGKFGSHGWKDKTFRVEGVPIPQRFLSLADGGEVETFPESDILPAEEIFGKVVKSMEMADVMIVWFQGFHAHILGTELRRHGFEFPEIHVCDPQLIFKMAYKYESGLKKNLESAVSFYGANMADFGSSGSPSRKVFAIRWVLDRLTEDDGAAKYLQVDSLAKMTKRLAQTNALDHISFRQFLEKKGKDVSELQFLPWPPAPDGVEEFDISKAPFSDFPELDVLFDEVTEPQSTPEFVPVEISNDPVHAYMMGGLGREFREMVPVEFDVGEDSAWIAAGVDNGAFRVSIETPPENMKAAQNVIHKWPVIIKGHTDAEFRVIETRQGEDGNNFAEMVLVAGQQDARDPGGTDWILRDNRRQ